jgi:hypothetical protein
MLRMTGFVTAHLPRKLSAMNIDIDTLTEPSTSIIASWRDCAWFATCGLTSGCWNSASAIGSPSSRRDAVRLRAW